ncbi:MAG: hypothetical protein FWE37_01755 [Spirochaetaceae bacterium]|nr:hypothetical protein [Spirochaetaceae bacterium]
MILKINNEQLNFELEAEETELGHILDKLIIYLRDEGYVLLQIKVNDGVIDLKTADWQRLKLTEINELNLTAELMLELDEAVYALKLAEEALLAANKAALLKMQPMWLKLAYSIRFWLAGFAVEEKLYAALLQLDSLPLEAASKLVKLFIDMLNEKENELNDVYTELNKTITDLCDHKDILTSLSKAFQQNNDAKAMQDMLNFMQLFQKIIRLSSFMPIGKAKEELVKLLNELSGQLSAFTEACSARDYILAADIAEYEISERLPRLLPIIALLKE